MICLPVLLILTREFVNPWQTSQSTRETTLLMLKRGPKLNFILSLFYRFEMKTMTPRPVGLVIFLATSLLVPTIAWDIPKSGLASQPRIEDVKQRPRLCPPPPPLQFWNFWLFIDLTACNQPSQIWPGLNDYRTMIHSGMEYSAFVLWVGVRQFLDLPTQFNE